MSDGGPVAARGDQGIFQLRGHIRRFHRRAEPPGDDVAAVIVEDGREVAPPADDLQIGELGRVVFSWNSSAALIITEAGLVTRRCAFRSP